MASKVERAVAGSIEYPKSHGTRVKRKALRNGNLPRVFGADIEADSETAEPFLLCVDGGIHTYDIHLQSWGDVIDGLCRFSLRDSVNFFYNLQYDFEGMVRLLPHEAGIRLLAGEKVRLNSRGGLVEQGGHYLSYIPKKGFTIGIGKNVWRFFDLWQYYLCGLADAVWDNLPGEAKGDMDTAEMSYEEYRVSKEYRDEVLKYCRQDARLCRLLGEIIVEGANRYVNTDTFFSSAGVSEQYFRSNGFVTERLPSWATTCFMRAYKGGRFEAVKRGAMQGVTAIDIKSAYPYWLSKMPVVTSNLQTKGYNGSVDFEARFGAYKATIDVPQEWYMGPVGIKDRGALRYPVGTFTEWVDLVTIEMLERYQVPYKIHEGVEVFQDEVGTIKPLIDPLFEIKEDKSNPPSMRYAAKINMNGLYGKIIQLQDDVLIREVTDIGELDDLPYGDIIHTYDKWFKRIHSKNFGTGKLFAPYYGAYITSGTRRQLFEKAWELGLENIIAMHTDSLFYKGPSIETGTGLGDWEIEKHFENADLGLVKPGVYSLEKGKHRKVKSRGIGAQKEIHLPKYKVKRRYGLNRAIRNNWDGLNVIKSEPMKQSLNGDKKRIWERELTGDDFKNQTFVESAPYQYPL